VGDQLERLLLVNDHGRPFVSSLRIVRAARACGDSMSSQWIWSGSLVWSVSLNQNVGRKSGSAGRGVEQM
jgi:hypothetical protein